VRFSTRVADDPFPANNLLEHRLEAAEPFRLWVADFACPRPAEGWPQVAALLDLYCNDVTAGDESRYASEAFMM